MGIDDPLDFEVDDPLVPTPSPARTKRRKLIGLDDLLTDHYKEETKLMEKNGKDAKSKKGYNSDDDEDMIQINKEKELSNLVDNCQKQVHEMATDDDIPLWGLQVFGHQKLPASTDTIDLHDRKLLQSFSMEGSALMMDLGIDRVLQSGESFFAGLLKNGWLLKLVYAVGLVEHSIASWTFGQMLYSSNDELHSSACEFWCDILLSNEVDMSSIKPDLISYSKLKFALETYGYIFDYYNSLPSSKLVNTDSGCQGPSLNIKSWIKFVAVLCQSRFRWPMLSTSEVEDLLCITISLFLDRQLQGLSVLLDECLRSVIGFFTEDEWCISCEKVTNFIACRIPKDLNCLRIVESISLANARSKNLRSEIAFQILIHCFDKRVANAKEILKFLTSINLKDKNCDFVKLYIYLVLVENWLCSDPSIEEKTAILEIWCKCLRNCSTQINSTDWRSYASKVRNRASYLSQSQGANIGGGYTI